MFLFRNKIITAQKYYFKIFAEKYISVFKECRNIINSFKMNYVELGKSLHIFGLNI